MQIYMYSKLVRKDTKKKAHIQIFVFFSFPIPPFHIHTSHISRSRFHLSVSTAQQSTIYSVAIYHLQRSDLPSTAQRSTIYSAAIYLPSLYQLLVIS